MNFKKIGKVFTSKFVGTGPLVFWKKNLRGRSLTKVEKHCSTYFEQINYSSSGGSLLYMQHMIFIVRLLWLAA